MNTRSRKRRLITVVATLLSIGIAALPALAHHSYAMYDMAVEKTITGKLKRYVLGANHSQYVLEVVSPDGKLALNEKGEPLIWNVETGAAAQLARQGITVESFKIGTVFTVTFSPLRDGRNGGAQRPGTSIVMCGMTLPEGGCNEKTGKKY